MSYEQKKEKTQPDDVLCPQCQQPLKDIRYSILFHDLEELAVLEKPAYLKRMYMLARDERKDPKEVTDMAKDFMEGFPIASKNDICDTCHRIIVAIAKLENGLIVVKWQWHYDAIFVKPERHEREATENAPF